MPRQLPSKQSNDDRYRTLTTNMLSLINIFSVIELICLSASLFFLRNERGRFWKITICYLTLVCAVEILGRILSKMYGVPNAWLYTLFIFFEVTYIIYGMYYFLKDYAKVKLPILISYSIFLIIYIFEIYSKGIMGKNTLPIILLSIIAVLYSLWYYYLLLKSETFIVLNKHAPFWWIAGVLLFYFGGIVITLFDPIFKAKIYDGRTLRYYIFILLNLILYSLWTYAFICRKRQHKFMD